jgi:FtsZ-binding cell division protein ZapB
MSRVDRIYRLEMMKHNGQLSRCPNCHKIVGLSPSHPLIASIGCSCPVKTRTEVSTSTGIMEIVLDDNFFDYVLDMGRTEIPDSAVPVFNKKEVLLPGEIPVAPKKSSFVPPAVTTPVKVKIEPQPLPAQAKPAPAVSGQEQLLQVELDEAKQRTDKATKDLINKEIELGASRLQLITAQAKLKLDEKQLTHLRTTVETLKTKIENLKNKNTQLDQHVTSGMSGNEGLITQNEQLTTALDRINQINKQLMEANEKLTLDVQDVTSTKEANQKRYEQLITANNQLAEAKLTKALREAGEEQDRLRRETKKEKLQMKQRHTNAISEKDQELGAASAGLEELTRKVVTLEDERKGLVEKLRVRSDQEEKLKAQIKSLEAENSFNQSVEQGQIDQQVEQFKAKEKQWSATISLAREVKEEQQKTIEKLKVELEQAKEQNVNQKTAFQNGNQIAPPDTNATTLLDGADASAVADALLDGSVTIESLLYAANKYDETADVPDMDYGDVNAVGKMVYTMGRANKLLFKDGPLGISVVLMGAPTISDLSTVLLKYAYSKNTLKQVNLITIEMLKAVQEKEQNEISADIRELLDDFIKDLSSSIAMFEIATDLFKGQVARELDPELRKQNALDELFDRAPTMNALLSLETKEVRYWNERLMLDTSVNEQELRSQLTKAWNNENERVDALIDDSGDDQSLIT